MSFINLDLDHPVVRSTATATSALSGMEARVVMGAGDAEGRAQLVRMLTDERDADLRWEAARALARTGVNADALIRALGDTTSPLLTVPVSRLPSASVSTTVSICAVAPRVGSTA